MYFMAVNARMENDFATAYDILERALNTPITKESFTDEDRWIFDYGLLFEFSIAAFWMEDYCGSLDACDRILAMPGISTECRQYTEYNRKIVLKRVYFEEEP